MKNRIEKHINAAKNQEILFDENEIHLIINKRPNNYNKKAIKTLTIVIIIGTIAFGIIANLLIRNNNIFEKNEQSVTSKDINKKTNKKENQIYDLGINSKKSNHELKTDLKSTINHDSILQKDNFEPTIISLYETWDSVLIPKISLK